MGIGRAGDSVGRGEGGTLAEASGAVGGRGVEGAVVVLAEVEGVVVMAVGAGGLAEDVAAIVATGVVGLLTGIVAGAFLA